jgi:hypothetical protein
VDVCGKLDSCTEAWSQLTSGGPVATWAPAGAASAITVAEAIAVITPAARNPNLLPAFIADLPVGAGSTSRTFRVQSQGLGGSGKIYRFTHGVST